MRLRYNWKVSILLEARNGVRIGWPRLIHSGELNNRFHNQIWTLWINCRMPFNRKLEIVMRNTTKNLGVMVVLNVVFIVWYNRSLSLNTQIMRASGTIWNLWCWLRNQMRSLPFIYLRNLLMMIINWNSNILWNGVHLKLLSAL